VSKREQIVVGPSSPKQAAFLEAVSKNDLVLFGGAA
jgi:hypothetical protein